MITLIQTCGACPEQYDAFMGDRKVGYLRLRHGYFSVECPHVDGELVYSAHPEGDGCFDCEERDKYLEAAKAAIEQWLAKRCMESNPCGPDIRPTGYPCDCENCTKARSASIDRMLQAAEKSGAYDKFIPFEEEPNNLTPADTSKLNDWHLFHRLWTKAVGTPDYIKSEWIQLEGVIVRSKQSTDPDERKNIQRLIETVRLVYKSPTSDNLFRLGAVLLDFPGLAETEASSG